MESESIVPSGATIDFSCLDSNAITPNMYILLHWRYNANYKLPEIMEHLLEKEECVLQYLEEEGFIKIRDGYRFDLRQKGIDLFVLSSPEEKWLEFLGTFPAKVPSRSGGTRPLKISNPDSKKNQKISAKYIKLIKNDPNMHTFIMDVLHAEMTMRRQSNEMQFMHNMDTWLNQEDYNAFAYLLDEPSSTTSDYGQTIV